MELFYLLILYTLLSPPEALSEESYRQNGNFVTSNDSPDFFKALQFGDVIYADTIQPRNQVVGLSRPQQLHLAVYLGKHTDPLVVKHFPDLHVCSTSALIYHATFVHGETTVWDTTKFRNHYRPFAAKRIIGPVLQPNVSVSVSEMSGSRQPNITIR